MQKGKYSELERIEKRKNILSKYENQKNNEGCDTPCDTPCSTPCETPCSTPCG